MLQAAKLEGLKHLRTKIPGIKHGVKGLGFALVACSFTLVWNFSTMPSFLPFEIGTYIPFHDILEVCNLLFDFIEAYK